MKSFSYSMFFAVGTRYTLEVNRRETTFPAATKYRERIVDISEGNLIDFASALKKNRALKSLVLRISKHETRLQTRLDGSTFRHGSDLGYLYDKLTNTVHPSYEDLLPEFLEFIEALRECCSEYFPV